MLVTNDNIDGLGRSITGRTIGRVSKQLLFFRDLLFIERFTSSVDHDVSSF